MVRFDHALIFVADLEAAVRDYGARGFTVVPGGAHEGDPTKNALVPFADGSYLELIAFRRRSTLVLLRTLGTLGLVARAVRAPLARRFAVRAAHGQGLVDVAVGVDSLTPVIERARGAGRTIHGPVRGRRTTADGAAVVWDLGVPRDDDLPLLIADVTPRPLRVAVTAGLAHANGVIGVTRAVLPVRDPVGTASCFLEVLGLSSREDGTGRSIDIGTVRLHLEPAGAVPTGRPVSLTLATAHGAVFDLA